MVTTRAKAKHDGDDEPKFLRTPRRPRGGRKKQQTRGDGDAYDTDHPIPPISGEIEANLGDVSMSMADEDVEQQRRTSLRLEEFDVEVEKRINQMRTHAANLALTFQSKLQVELMKLPKKIRNMKWGELKEKFGGRISLVVEDEVRKTVDSIPKTPGPNAFRSMNIPEQTPGPSAMPNNMNTVFKTTRRAKRNEQFMSINGSPLQVPQAAPATVSRATIKKGKVEEIAIAIDDQGEMKLDDTFDFASLDDQAKAAAKKHLETLQSQIESLMKALDGANVDSSNFMSANVVSTSQNDTSQAPIAAPATVAKTKPKANHDMPMPNGYASFAATKKKK